MLKRKNRVTLSAQKGFTLIELIMAVTIFSLVAVGIASSFFSGIKLWNKAKEDIAAVSLFLSVDSIAGELRQSANVKPIGFEGSATDVSFPYVSGNAVLKVTYKFDPSSKRLTRATVPLKDIIAESEAQNYQGKEVLSLDDLTLSYFYFDKISGKYLWKDNWAKNDGVFTAVKLHCRSGNEEFSRTVFIPWS
ncbi:MAG: type II secretion system protein [Candidatus Omnitrophica bacterium]|nr:type II secretion system protein [Candidatus Omnitrophota bacterium]